MQQPQTTSFPSHQHYGQTGFSLGQQSFGGASASAGAGTGSNPSGTSRTTNIAGEIRQTSGILRFNPASHIIHQTRVISGRSPTNGSTGSTAGGIISRSHNIETTPYYRRQPSADDSVGSDENNASGGTTTKTGSPPPNLISEQNGGFGVRQRKNGPSSSSSFRSPLFDASTNVEYDRVKMNGDIIDGEPDPRSSSSTTTFGPPPPRQSRVLGSMSLSSRSFSDNAAVGASASMADAHDGTSNVAPVSNTNDIMYSPPPFVDANDISNAWSKWVVVICDSNPFVMNWIAQQLAQIGTIHRHVGVPSLSSLPSTSNPLDQARRRNWMALEYDTELYAKKAQAQNPLVLHLPSSFAPYFSSFNKSASSSSQLFGGHSNSNNAGGHIQNQKDITVGVTILPLTKDFANRLGLAFQETVDDHRPPELLLSLPMEVDEVSDRTEQRSEEQQGVSNLPAPSPNGERREDSALGAVTGGGNIDGSTSPDGVVPAPRDDNITAATNMMISEDDIYFNPGAQNDPRNGGNGVVNRSQQEQFYRQNRHVKPGVVERVVTWWFKM